MAPPRCGLECNLLPAAMCIKEGRDRNYWALTAFRSSLCNLSRFGEAEELHSSDTRRSRWLSRPLLTYLHLAVFWLCHSTEIQVWMQNITTL